MPLSSTEAFERRHITRSDGVAVLPRPLISVAALEAGYKLDSSVVNDAVKSTKYPGEMTSDEFCALCDNHQSSFLSAEAVAKAVVAVSPSGVITRGSFEEIVSKANSNDDILSAEEVDCLFSVLDKDNKSYITADEFMRALYGEEGGLCLAERRKQELQDVESRKASGGATANGAAAADATQNGTGDAAAAADGTALKDEEQKPSGAGSPGGAAANGADQNNSAGAAAANQQKKGADGTDGTKKDAEAKGAEAKDAEAKKTAPKKKKAFACC